MLVALAIVALAQTAPAPADPCVGVITDPEVAARCDAEIAREADARRLGEKGKKAPELAIVTVVTGARSEVDVSPRIERSGAQLRYCHERARAAAPAPGAGSGTFAFEIPPAGAPITSSFSSHDATIATLGPCLTRVIDRLDFGPADGVATVAVTVTFAPDDP